MLLSSITSFISIGIDYYFKRFGFSYINSGYLLLIPYCAGFLSSFLWNLIPRKRTNAFIDIPIIVLIAFISLFFLPNSDEAKIQHYIVGILCLFLIGLGYGGYLMKVIPSTSLTVCTQYSGAAYGLHESFVNLNYLLVPYLSSQIVKMYQNQG